MKNKELIELLLDMDLEKEVTIKKTCMALELNKKDVKETDKRIEISGY